MIFRPLAPLACGTLLLAAMANPAVIAQSPRPSGPAAASGSSPGTDGRIFEANFFAAHAPVSALDMIAQLPGFVLSEGDTSRRGLADSFGNLLIDGARPSNKSVPLSTVLRRIPAATVLRIELVQGDMSGMERHGHARLANIVLRQNSGQSGSYQFLLQHMADGRVMPLGSASITHPFERGEFTAGLEISLWSARESRRRLGTNATGAPLYRSEETDQVLDRGVTPTLSLDLEMEDGASLRLDADMYFWTYHRAVFRTGESADPGGYTPSQFLSSQTRDHGANHRLAGSYERRISANLTSQTIALASQEIMENGPERVETFLPETGFLRAEIVRFSDRQEEYALRQNFTWQPAEYHSVSFGAETALNRGDTRLAISLETRGPSSATELPVSVSLIEEVRSEVFAEHVWTINPRAAITSGLRWEYSQLSLDGDARQDRDFAYLKPSVTLDYSWNDRHRARLSLRRDVDQLRFSKFANSVDLTDNSSTIGNPDYVPQNLWIAELEFERRWGESGAVLLRLDRSWARDLDDWIPVQSGTRVFDAPGNIGDGTRWRAKLELSTDLVAFGLDNAQFDLAYTFQHTNVSDPLTLQDRSWSGTRDHVVSLEFRQSLPARQLAWGWEYDWRTPATTYRAQEIWRDGYPTGALDIFLETSRWGHSTLRAGVREVIEADRDRQRVFFAGSRASGLIARTENRTSTHGPLVYLELTGSF